MGSIVDTVEIRIQNAIMTAIDIFTPWIELAVRSMNACSGQDAASITGNSERGECIGIAASLVNAFKRNNSFYDINAKDETRRNISVSGTRFDRQPHTHHNFRKLLVLWKCCTDKGLMRI